MDNVTTEHMDEVTAGHMVGNRTIEFGDDDRDEVSAAAGQEGNRIQGFARILGATITKVEIVEEREELRATSPPRYGFVAYFTGEVHSHAAAGEQLHLTDVEVGRLESGEKVIEVEDD